MNLSVDMCVEQGDFASEVAKKLDISYGEVESQMCDLGFYQGNGDVTFSLAYPDEEEINAVGAAMIAYMREMNYPTIRVYEDH